MYDERLVDITYTRSDLLYFAIRFRPDYHYMPVLRRRMHSALTRFPNRVFVLFVTANVVLQSSAFLSNFTYKGILTPPRQRHNLTF